MGSDLLQCDDTPIRVLDEFFGATKAWLKASGRDGCGPMWLTSAHGRGMRHLEPSIVCAGLEGGAWSGHLANASGILQADGYKG